MSMNKYGGVDEIKDMGYAEGLRYIVMKESFYDKPLYKAETEGEE